jgi:hypothetical protein
MNRESSIASQIFWDHIRHDRIMIELHRFQNKGLDDPDYNKVYVFYKSKLATIRSVPAALDASVANKIHKFIAGIYPNIEDLEEKLDSWLKTKL